MGVHDGQRSSGQCSSDERGASLPLMALVLVVLLIVTSVVVGITERVMDRARAQAAADAAALAGVMDGRTGAGRLATANGAVLVSFEASPNTVHVVVAVDGRRAEARAERSLVLRE